MKRTVVRPKYFILFILSLLLTGDLMAQRKTTNVKGYYRKDGTYVRPHTRGYTAATNSAPFVPMRKNLKVSHKDSLRMQSDSITYINSTSLDVVAINVLDQMNTEVMGKSISTLMLLDRDDEIKAGSNTNYQVDTGNNIYISTKIQRPVSRCITDSKKRIRKVGF